MQLDGLNSSFDNGCIVATEGILNINTHIMNMTNSNPVF